MTEPALAPQIPKKTELELTTEISQLKTKLGEFNFTMACLKQDCDRMYVQLFKSSNELQLLQNESKNEPAKTG